MAKNRLVNTVFWEDNYTANLDPIEKLMFLYFLTNGSTNISGIYQITLKKIAVETGIDKEMVEKIIKRFEGDGKVFYRDGWLGIRNFIKHQNQNSPKVKKGIEIEMERVPEEMKDALSGKGIDTLSHSNLTKLNLTKLNTAARGAASGDGFNVLGAEIIKAFEEVDPRNKTYYGNTSQRNACDFLIEQYGLDEVMKRISILPKTNKIAYFPSITSPVQLRDKWVQLQDTVERKRIEVKGKANVAFV